MTEQASSTPWTAPPRVPIDAASRRRVRRPARGGATPSSTRSTSAASRTATATARRPRRRPRPPAVPARPRRRRDLVHALVPSPLADGGYDVADYRAIDPRVRHAGGGGGAHRRGARARHPDHRRRRPQPHLRPARVVPGGARRRPRLAGARRGSGSTRARARTATRCPTQLGVRLPGQHLDADDEPGRHARRVVPAPVRAAAARPQLGPPRRARASSRTCCASGSTAASPASASTRPRCWSRTPALPEVPRHPGPGEHPHVDRDEIHDIYRGWRAVADSYPGTRVLVGEVWLPDIERFAQYLRPDEMHTAFNFDFMARPWDAERCASPST